MISKRKTDGLAQRAVLGIMARWLAKQRKARTSPQLAVLSADTVGDAVLLNGLYEKSELEALTDWLTRTDPHVFRTTVLDIGGNIGNHAVYFADFFERVISFEPNPRVFPLLDYNLSAIPSTVAHNLALSDTTGNAKLEIPAGNLGGARVGQSSQGVKIRLERLDDQYLGPNRVGLVKLDVEGHELKVLEGGRNRIIRDRPIVVFEQHASEIVDGSCPVLDWLRQADYRSFFTVARPDGLFGKLRPVEVRQVGQLTRRNHPMVIALPAHRDAGAQ